MTFKRMIARQVALSFFIFLGQVALADVLIDNLGEPIRDTTILGTELWAGQGFSTDGQAYTLDNITITAGLLDGAANPVAELRASTVDGHIDTSPGGLLTTFTVPDLSGELSERTLVPDQSVVLTASTRYFFVLGGSGAGTFGWTYANSNNWTGNGHFANYEYSEDMGLTWTDFGGDFPYFMRVSVTPYTLTENLNPLSYTILIGFDFTGDLASLFSSDDDCLGIFPDEVSLWAQVQFDSQTTILNPSQLTFTCESYVAREGLSQAITLYDYDTSTWVPVDGRLAPTTDTTISITLFGESPGLVGPSGELSAIVSWQPINDEDPAQDGWPHCVDLVSWEVTF